MNFLLQIVIMLSLAIMVYMVARKVPQLDDTVSVEITPKQTGLAGKIDKVFDKVPLERLDFWFTQVLEKFLRKSRVFLLKLDNKLVHHLEKFKRIKRSQEQMKAKKFELFESAQPITDNRQSITEEGNKDKENSIS